MPPYSSATAKQLFNESDIASNNRRPTTSEVKPQQPSVIVWKNIILFILLHSSIFYSLYSLIVFRPWKTLIFGE